MSSLSQPHVYVKASGDRFAWAVHNPVDCDRTSTETFATAGEAAEVGAKIAVSKGLPFAVANWPAPAMQEVA